MHSSLSYRYLQIPYSNVIFYLIAQYFYVHFMCMQFILLAVLLLYYSTVVVLFQEIRQPTNKVKVEKNSN